MKYIPVIGLEIHAELMTETKAFCGCSNSFGQDKNSNTCPVCLALPGALPVLNQKAVQLAISAGLLCGSEITPITIWDRKNYFYPDLAKAYQISQLYAPICVGGGLEVNGRYIRFNRIHLEEDAGKLLHERGSSIIDYNRAGVPLIECVTEPDIRSSDEAVEFVEKFRRILIYGDICDGKMEQGSLRVDANISIMPENSIALGTRAEIKNINSFRFLKRAIEFEIERQTELLSNGGRIVQETRRYDEVSGETFSMRSKEDAHDYRYFPDPDVLPLIISAEDVEEIRNTLPEPPNKRYDRYVNKYMISGRDADTILAERATADFYDAVINEGADPKAAANSIKGELLRLLGEKAVKEIPVSPKDFAKALELASNLKISQDGLKAAITYMFQTGEGIDKALKEKNLIITENQDLIKAVIAEIVAEDPDLATRYKAGENKLFSYLFGQCMKKLKGKALPQSINLELIKELTE
ncbi:MAG: Asp-tRNA(Asn)/Glu-tRNA(Gln) amidotransferase subunit GatB [Clostridiales bacterium]|nr:Asp-tRNA(Asn)/Glu-tRNA(Gln) amidotransferase subunit GatB [Clostridiales bacterium]